MSSLNELVHYCNEPDPIGALMLTGEWGCGKTYLVEKELAKALEDTHILVRVSLFGMTSASMLRETVRRRWFEVCMPLIGALQKAQDEGVFRAFINALGRFNPLAGGAASVVVSTNMQDLIPIKPEIEDLVTHQSKIVVLIYDDLERAKMDFPEVLGVVNDYCENQGFNSIISVNEESLKPELEQDLTTYHLLKEKTISQVLYHIPDYGEVIHKIIDENSWQSPEYKEYLLSKEELIRNIFISDEEAEDVTSLVQENRRNHNFRTLTKGLQSFYRIFHHMNENGIEITDAHLASFFAYYLFAKSGVMKDGKPILSFGDKDISEYYPQYSAEAMADAEREWIKTGIWHKKCFLKEIGVDAQ